MAKARDAFRTISEVSDWLDTPAHVLRFWESKFTQVKPVKRAGGRRYYRPEDMELLGGIKVLLHDQGMTIKGAQKLLREKGIKEVAALAPDLDGDQQKKPMPKVKKSKPAKEAVAPEATTAPVKLTSVPTSEPDQDQDQDAPAEQPREVETRPDAALHRPLSRRPQTTAEPDTAPTPENVVSFTAMPPPSAHPTLVKTDEPSKDDVAATTDDETQPDPAPAQEPLLPRETPTPAEPRIFAALRDANEDNVRKRAAQIAPLLARLEEVRDRMRSN